MRGEISWHVELTVKSGELDNFRALTTQMVESTKREPGALIYERFLSDDARTAYIYERYADCAAAETQLLAFAKMYGARYASMVDRRRFTVFGAPTDTLRTILNRFGTTCVGLFDSFFRGSNKEESESCRGHRLSVVRRHFLSTLPFSKYVRPSSMNTNSCAPLSSRNRTTSPSTLIVNARIPSQNGLWETLVASADSVKIDTSSYP